MRIRTYAEFWPFYLREHSRRGTRVLHFIGTTAGLVCIVLLLATKNWIWIPGGLLTGYALAWIGHFTIEKNRPATFRYPLWSFYSDWKMWFFTITGKNLN